MYNNNHLLNLIRFTVSTLLPCYSPGPANIYASVAPEILQFSFGESPLNYGEMLSVTCSIIKGDLPVNLTWMINDKPIDPTRTDINVQMNKRVSFLSIDSVTARHAGRYECMARNTAGVDRHTAHLSVNGTSDNDNNSNIKTKKKKKT